MIDPNKLPAAMVEAQHRGDPSDRPALARALTALLADDEAMERGVHAYEAALTDDDYGDMRAALTAAVQEVDDG